MVEQEKKEKKKERKNPLEGKTAKVIHPGDKQKSAILITDGSNVNIQLNNINKLEFEMMLVKALQYVRST